jgi:catechol 2,3-dioxygenase-like lactoylglutathione lyase family enzyme
MELIHTCYRITDIDRSVAFCEALGFEERRRMPIREDAINVFMGLPGDGDRLELTYNFGVNSWAGVWPGPFPGIFRTLGAGEFDLPGVGTNGAGREDDRPHLVKHAMEAGETTGRADDRGGGVDDERGVV